MVFQYYDASTGDYVTINLDELVSELETNTFIRKVDAYIDTNGDDIPTTYYYFSEEAIKDWMALDPTANTDAEANMEVTEPGVIAINVVGDVVENFEYILEQEITYEGEQVTIEEIIQMISSEVDGNVIYTEVGGEMVFQYYDASTGDYVTIDLGTLVTDLETKTKITRASIAADGETPNYGDTVETDPTVAGQILYKYESEDGIDYLNITEDMLFAIENNNEVRNTINDILNEGGNVLFGDVTIGTENYTDVLYYFDVNGDPQLIDVAKTLIQNLIDNSTQLQELKNLLGDKYEDNSIIYTGDTINGDPVAGFKTTTTIGAHTAVTSGVTLPVTPLGVISISLYQNGNLITNSTTDHVITGSDIDFNIGIGNHYQVLPAGEYEVIIEFTVAP
ncbi:hypothetical protein CAP47_02090 [Psychroflexus sp. S27]|nr:hypothetical protein CAP47_02090 [Psychroflexus sp. S27]